MKRYAEYKDSGIEWIGAIPENWDIKKLKYISSMKSGNSIPSEKIEGSGKYPVYGGNGLRGYTGDYTHEGDYILIGRQGALCGNVRKVFGRFWPSEHAVVVYDNDSVDKNWYSYFLEIMNLNQYSTSAAQPGLSVEQIINLSACVPPRERQESIAFFLNAKTAAIDTLIADKQKLIDLLKEKRQAIISEAVTKGLDKNAKMKDSGIEWIGEIPEDWEVLPLFAVANENQQRNTNLVNNNLLSLSYGKIVNKDIETNFGLLPESFETYQIVEKGYTILRLTDLQNDKRSLRSGYVPEKGIITSAYVGLVPSEKVDDKYLSDLLHAYDLMKIFYGLGNGVRQSINYKDLKRMPLPVPPVYEQERISEYLAAKTAKVDTLIFDIQTQIEKLKEYRQSIISEAVTGKVAI